MNNQNKEVQMVFTTEKIEEIKNKVEQGFKIARHEKYWAENYILTKKDGIVFNLSEDELYDYAKCKLGVDINDEPYYDPSTQTLYMTGIEYFAEKYCKVKNELGQVKNIRLRDYQKGILNMFMENRYSIIIASRQIGKCNSPTTKIKINNKNISLYKIWFSSLEKKTILDYIKYGIYSIIDLLD